MKLRLILDADHGIDDTMATMYLASQADVEIVAVGTVHGNAESPQAALNALQVLETLGLAHVPVAIGAAAPLAQGVDIATMVHGADGLGGQGRNVGLRPTKESAAEQLVRLARSAPGEYSLLATGPLTNVALALLLEPELPSLLDQVVIMGGTIAVPGNISPVAEANLWHDPEAADAVFRSMPNVTLVPLDVTTRNWVDDAALAAIADSAPGASNELLRSILVQYEGFYRTTGERRGFPLHDPSAAILAVKPHLADYLDSAIDVELRGEHTRGMLIVDRRVGAAPSAHRPTVRIAMSMDPADTVAEFLTGALRTQP